VSLKTDWFISIQTVRKRRS